LRSSVEESIFKATMFFSYPAKHTMHALRSRLVPKSPLVLQLETKTSIYREAAIGSIQCLFASHLHAFIITAIISIWI
jgi:hypothetical protein